MKVVTVLIPIHNRLSVTQQGLYSLFESLNDYYSKRNNKNCEFQVVVIDDGSKDGSAEWIKENYPDIHLLIGDGNLWWSGAINQGARYAIETLKSDYLLLWNDDIIPTKSYVNNVAEYLVNNPLRNTIMGSKILVHGKHDEIWSLGGYFNKYNGRIGLIRSIKNQSNECVICDWQPGMGSVIPSDIIKDLNLWWDAVRFPHYHGDSDFTLRCKRKGVKILTNLNWILYNQTELSGVRNKKSLKDVYLGLTSIKSNYNIFKNFKFCNRHGVIPTAYWGFIQNYFFYLGGFVKHSLLPKRQN